MLPGVNAKQMRQAMKKMGIQQEDIDATHVIIHTTTGEIHIQNPSVARVKMMGQETFQISGTIVEKEASAGEPEISEDDISMVAAQAGVSSDEAKRALEEAEGDIAQAIMQLSNE